MDVLVKWDKNSEVNVVSTKDIQLLDGNCFKNGARVKMLWENGVWWKGTIEQVEDDDEAMETGNDSSDEEVPLAHLVKRPKGKTLFFSENIINLNKL